MEEIKPKPKETPVPWSPWLAVLFILLIFYGSQILAGILISLYAGLQHWSHAEISAWLDDSVLVQFSYILIAETVAIGAIYLYLKRYKLGLAAIGLRRPRWSDAFYGLAALPLYLILYVLTVGVVSHFVSGLQVDQQQIIGFNNVHGPVELAMTFISLVILPPLAEEIMVRGFLYSSFKKALPVVWAALLTSALFALAHLPEGGDAGPLYIAALDTFVLSLVLVFLREKTGGLWAPITLHALKNGIAFVALFALHAR